MADSVDDQVEGGPVVAPPTPPAEATTPEVNSSSDSQRSMLQSSSAQQRKGTEDAAAPDGHRADGDRKPDAEEQPKSDEPAPAWFAPYLERLAKLEKGAEDNVKSGKSSSDTTRDDADLSLEVKRLSMEKWQPGRGLNSDEIRSNVLVVYYKTVVKKSATDKSPVNPETPTPVERSHEVPQRVQINSRPLLAELEFMTGTTMAKTPCVMIPPFKVFITYRDKIEEELRAKKSAIRQWEADAETDADMICPTNVKAEEERKKERVVIEHLECLLKWIDEDLAGTLELRRKVLSRTLKTISYENLWLLFRVGEMVFNNHEALKGRNVEWLTYPRAFRVFHFVGGRPPISGARGNSQPDPGSIKGGADSGPERRDVKQDGKQDEYRLPFKVGLHGTDYDGEVIGAYIGPTTFVFRDFKGEKPIMELDMYPAEFDPNFSQRYQALLARGRRFLDLLQPSHRYYTGPTLGDDPEEIEGEIVVDPKTGYDSQPDSIVLKPDGISPIALNNPSLEFFETTGCGDASCPGCTNNWDDNLLAQKYYVDYNAEDQGLRAIWLADTHEKSKITDEHLIYMPKDILGFVLRTRTWKWLDIELIKRVEDQEEEERLGFKELVINEKHKAMVLALVQSHHSGPRVEAGGSMDLVKGKGRGLIILLHGAPGVGKTSTAETVAAYTKRPLYPITCGDIGEKADEVEKTLERHFKLAHKWGCVLLLDEADVFLAKRSEGDVQRNALVSVFLRTLEYYSGILFLTTNRLGVIDEAFHSRIKMSFFYDNLSWEKTRKIWRNCIKKIKRTSEKAQDTDLIIKCVDEDAILDFARKHFEDNKQLSQWNGRQIRNAFQTAIALARYDLHTWVDRRIERRKVTSEEAKTKEKYRTVKLTAEHFARVAEVTTEYHRYVKRMQRGKTSEQLAVASQLRATGEDSDAAPQAPGGRGLRMVRQPVGPADEAPPKRDKAKKAKAAAAAAVVQSQPEPVSGSDSESETEPQPVKGKAKQLHSDSDSGSDSSSDDDDD